MLCTSTIILKDINFLFEDTSSSIVDTPNAAIVDIKSVVKAKSKKKKSSESAAVRIAREEALKSKSKKKNRDKSSFNEFSI